MILKYYISLEIVPHTYLFIFFSDMSWRFICETRYTFLKIIFEKGQNNWKQNTKGNHYINKVLTFGLVPNKR